MCGVSRRASGGTLAAFLILAAIVGFAGGAYLGTQSESNGDDADAGANPPAETAPPDDDTGNVNGATDNESDGDDQSDEDESDSDSTVTLSFEQTSATPDEEVAYSGQIESGESGIRLQLQRSVNDGPWEDFPVDPRVTDDNGEFGGTAISSREGENRFRMVGVDDESIVSEVVTITIG